MDFIGRVENREIKDYFYRSNLLPIIIISRSKNVTHCISAKKNHSFWEHAIRKDYETYYRGEEKQYYYKSIRDDIFQVSHESVI